MKRDIYKHLCNWKLESNRRPLLLCGASQTGKTFIVSEFGKNEFDSFIMLNFERNPEYKDIFTTNIPKEIVERISLCTGKKVVPEKTLLFFDEIQECPQAIVSLRYFFEEMPQIHIIGAGSLLEFTLQSEDFRMPVGRIQYLFIFPLSFGEFLDALGEGNLRSHLLDFSNLPKLPETLHNKLNELVRKYFLLGGMPAVVDEYCKTGDILKCTHIQRSILDTYIDDFAKYSKKNQHRYLKKIAEAVPAMVGQKFVYARVDDSIKSRELKEAYDLLESAGLIYRIKRTSGAGLPLEAHVNDSFFKALFLDIGLMHSMNGIHAETAKEKDFTAIFKGAVSEQFAAQELIAYQSPLTKPSVYYWAREEKNSNAEIDYMIQKNSEIVPIEIKSGAAGHLKSLHMFLETFKISQGIKISQAPFQYEPTILSLPFYAIESFMKKD